MKKQNIKIALFALVLPLLGCSTQKDRWLNREYHALNTKYNVLFNGKEALRVGKAILLQNFQDDFRTILHVEPLSLPGESIEKNASIPSFALAEEKAVKAIQKHSMNIGGKQKNPQIQEAYMLLGESRYFDRRFFPALEAFTFLMDASKGQAIYDKAKLWREKTNLRLGNTSLALNNLQVLNNRLDSEHEIYSDLQATLAQAYVRNQQLDSALICIAQAAETQKRKDLQVRYQYIQAQLLEQQNRPQEAQEKYNSIVALNRKAPRVFWIQAKLQSARLEAQQNNKSPMESLERLAKAYENQTYLHLIRQAQARYLRAQGDDSLAVVFYNKSLQSPYIETISQAANYRDLATLFYAQGQYLSSGSYLDSLLQTLPEGKNKKRTLRERRGLDEVIGLETIIERNDSILRLTALNPEEQYAFFSNSIAQKRAQELEAVEEEKKSFFRFSGKEASNFYFYNPRLLVSGRQSFRATWGNRPNTDGWNRLSNLKQQIDDLPQAQQTTTTATGFFIETPEYLVQSLPTDPSFIDSLRNQRRQAQLDVGILYKERFDDRILAEKRFTSVLTDQPEPLQEATALYHSIKLFEEEDSKQAWAFRQRLLSAHPNTPFAQIIKDPDSYALASGQTPEGKFKQLYQSFLAGEYATVLAQAETLKIVASGTSLLPKIELLVAQTQGKLYGETALLNALEQIIVNFPNAQAAVYAKTTVKRLKSPTTLIPSKKQYKWVFAFPSSLELDALPQAMAQGAQKITRRKLRISNDSYNEQFQFVVVHTQTPLSNPEKFLQIWQEDPRFKQNTNNFVILGTEYADVQKQKTWKPTQNEK